MPKKNKFAFGGIGNRMALELVLSKEYIVSYYKNEIRKLMVKAMERNVEVSKKTVELKHILPEIAECFMEAVGSGVLLKDADVKFFFGGMIQKDFSKTKYGTIGEVNGPVCFSYHEGTIKVQFQYTITTKAQPGIHLN